MPSIILDRIPLPNLKLYATGSVFMVSCCIYFAIISTNNPDWRTLNNNTLVTPFSEQELIGSDSLLKVAVDGINNLESKVLSSPPPPPPVDELFGTGDGGSVGIDAAAAAAEINAKCSMHEEQPLESKASNLTDRTLTEQFKDVVAFMCQEPFCIWVSDSHNILFNRTLLYIL